VARGVSNRCPNCGGHTLFKKGTFFELNKECPRCGLKLDHDEGFFLGSMSLNYGVTIVCFLGPVLYAAYKGWIGATAVIVLAGAGAVIVPALLYRSSRSWWLMNYYFFLPQQLPSNRSGAPPGEDDNV
jgi:ribosomal protein S27AE